MQSDWSYGSHQQQQQQQQQLEIYTERDPEYLATKLVSNVPIPTLANVPPPSQSPASASTSASVSSSSKVSSKYRPSYSSKDALTSSGSTVTATATTATTVTVSGSDRIPPYLYRYGSINGGGSSDGDRFRQSTSSLIVNVDYSDSLRLKDAPMMIHNHEDDQNALSGHNTNGIPSFLVRYDPETSLADVDSRYIQFCRPDLLAQLDQQRELIRGLPPSVLTPALQRSNPYSNVRRAQFCERHAVVLAGLDSIFGFTKSPVPSIDAVQQLSGGGSGGGSDGGGGGGSGSDATWFVDLGSPKGSFSEYMLWRRCMDKFPVKGWSISPAAYEGYQLNTDTFNPGARQQLSTTPGCLTAVNGPDGSGNINRMDVVRELQDSIDAALRSSESNNFGVHVVFACCIMFGVDYIPLLDQERLGKRLLIGQLTAAFSVLAHGGALVVRLTDSYDIFTAEVLYLLYRMFYDMYIIKPLAAQPTTSEQYVVCLGLKVPEDNMYHIIQHFADVGRALDQAAAKAAASGSIDGAAPSGDPALAHIIDPYEMLNDLPFIQYLHSVNDQHVQRTVDSLDFALRTASAPPGSNTVLYDHLEIQRRCFMEWNLPVYDKNGAIMPPPLAPPMTERLAHVHDGHLRASRNRHSDLTIGFKGGGGGGGGGGRRGSRAGGGGSRLVSMATRMPLLEVRRNKPIVRHTFDTASTISSDSSWSTENISSNHDSWNRRPSGSQSQSRPQSPERSYHRRSRHSYGGSSRFDDISNSSMDTTSSTYSRADHYRDTSGDSRYYRHSIHEYSPQRDTASLRRHEDSRHWTDHSPPNANEYSRGSDSRRTLSDLGNGRDRQSSPQQRDANISSSSHDPRRRLELAKTDSRHEEDTLSEHHRHSKSTSNDPRRPAGSPPSADSRKSTAISTKSAASTSSVSAAAVTSTSKTSDPRTLSHVPSSSLSTLSSSDPRQRHHGLPEQSSTTISTGTSDPRQRHSAATKSSAESSGSIRALDSRSLAKAASIAAATLAITESDKGPSSDPRQRQRQRQSQEVTEPPPVRSNGYTPPTPELSTSPDTSVQPPPSSDPRQQSNASTAPAASAPTSSDPRRRR